MKTVLHIGAHRTGTTTFQSYMRRHKEALDTARIGFWGPWRTRSGLFAGITPGSGYGPGAELALQQRVDLRRDQGLRALVISDENMMGSVRETLKARVLYPQLADRLARYAAAFDGRVDRIILTIRSLEAWWRSAAFYGVSRGHRALMRDDAVRIALGDRSWQDVINDVARAFPDADVRVVPFECSKADARLLCSIATDVPGPVDSAPEWLNRAPTPDLLKGAKGWPFTERERAALRERYEDDLFWLRAGADGLAKINDTGPQTQLRRAG